jgi:hypothetical protein
VKFISEITIISSQRQLLSSEDCRALKTAIGTANYFPEGILFRSHPTNMAELYPGIGQKERPKLSGGVAANRLFQSREKTKA